MPFLAPRAMAWRTVVLAALLSFSHVPVIGADMWNQLFQDNLENAEAGEAEAQYEVGIMYLKGQGVAQDREKAVQWLKAASASGHEQAAAKLRRMDEQQSKFAELLKKADSGDAQTQYDVAMMYLKGRGVQKDEAQARKWLTKAAARGDEKSITRLGIVNFKGEGGKPDYSKALKLFNQVKSDSVLAQYYLGEMYAEGKGVTKDYKQAIGWYRKAADGGFNRAHGKIISLEEELAIEKRRAAKAKEEARAEQLAARAKPAKASKKVVAAQKKTAKKAARPAAKPAAKSASKPKQSPLEQLASKQWVRRDKPVEYLPSQVTDCDMEEGKLVCFSDVVNQTRGSQIVQYRVKSVIQSQNRKLVVSYRNLVLDVTSLQEVDDADQPLGYDDEIEQGYGVKTGWTKEHEVVCRIKAGKALDCLKDETYKVSISAGVGETRVAR